MPTTTSLLGTGLLVALIVAAGTGAQALNVSSELGTAIETAVDRAVRDLIVDWLDIEDAHGRVEDGRVHEIRLLVRPSGAATEVALDEITARQGDAPARVTRVEPVRDRDASLEQHRLDGDDLARVTLTLATPLERGQTTSVHLLDPGKAPLKVQITYPATEGTDGYVALDTDTRW